MSNVEDKTDAETLTGLIERIKLANSLSPSREISIVATKLEEALMWLNKKNEGKKEGERK